jgi:hypothetical protein
MAEAFVPCQSEHLQPLASPTAKSGDKSRQIGRNLGVGSAEFLAGTPARPPKIGVFGFLLQANFIQFANIWLK